MSTGVRGACAATAVLLFVATSGTARAQTRVTLDFDRAWRFHLGDVTGGEQVALDDSRWRALDLPHDWSIEGEFSERNPAGPAGGALPGGVAWYRKSFTMRARDAEALTFIDFD